MFVRQRRVRQQARASHFHPKQTLGRALVNDMARRLRSILGFRVFYACHLQMAAQALSDGGTGLIDKPAVRPVIKDHLKVWFWV